MLQLKHLIEVKKFQKKNLSFDSNMGQLLLNFLCLVSLIALSSAYYKTHKRFLENDKRRLIVNPKILYQNKRSNGYPIDWSLEFTDPVKGDLKFNFVHNEGQYKGVPVFIRDNTENGVNRLDIDDKVCKLKKLMILISK